MSISFKLRVQAEMNIINDKNRQHSSTLQLTTSYKTVNRFNTKHASYIPHNTSRRLDHTLTVKVSYDGQQDYVRVGMGTGRCLILLTAMGW